MNTGKLNRIFDPPRKYKWAAVILSIAALWFSLARLPVIHPIAICTYVLSTYTLIVVVLSTIKAIHYLLTDYQPKTAIGRILKDEEKRGLALMVWSTVYNSVFALIYLVSGWKNKLMWDSSVGAYYAMLTMLRAYLLYHTAKKDKETPEEIYIFRNCGIILFVLNLVLGIRAYQVTWHNITTAKNMIFMIAIALWTFFNVVTCTIRIIQNKMERSWLRSSDIAVKFATTLISLFNLQAAMNISFGGTPEFTHQMNFWCGNAVFLLIFLECVEMIRTARKQIRSNQ